MRLNKKLVTFIVCVVIATGFWFLSALSKDYSGQVNVPVIYTHLPKDKVVTNKLVDTLDVEIRTSGFKLILYRLYKDPDPIRIDMRTVRRTREEGYYFIATNARLERFSEQLDPGTRITKVVPDTIFVNFNKKMSKMVPVKLNAQIDFRKEYQLKDSIRLHPSTVKISGAPSVIEKIDYIPTETVTLRDVHKPISRRVKLDFSGERKQVEASVDAVRLEVPVAKFTEGSIELPVEVTGLPVGYSIRTFPDKVTVKYQVALSDFEAVKNNPQMFKLVADYSKVKEGSTKLKVELVKAPAAVRHPKVIPDKVEYIIRK